MSDNDKRDESEPEEPEEPESGKPEWEDLEPEEPESEEPEPEPEEPGGEAEAETRRAPRGEEPEEEELTVGGAVHEPAPSRGRPIIYDVIGGGVLLLVIVVGLYIFFGTGGERPRERQEPAQPREQAQVPEEQPTLEQPPPVEEWSPAEFKLPPPKQTSDVDQALADAQAAMEAGRLIEPEGDNALEYFRGVLESQPDNQEARDGIGEIVNRLVAQANAALDEGRLRDALEQVSAIQTIRPDAEGLAQLQSRVEEAREVIDLLSAASADLKAGRLVSPEDDNALATYRQVLELDADNADARQGVVNVERRLLEEATAAARDHDFQRASELLASAAGVREESGAVDETRQNIDEFRQRTLDQLSTQARTAIEGGDYEQAGDLVSQVERIAPDSDVSATLRQELTRAQVYARYQPGDTFQDDLADGGQGPTMVVLPIGDFRMGSPDSEQGHRSYEAPMHNVSFANGFAFSRSEVTVREFRDFVEDTGYRSDAQRDGSSSVYSEDSGRMERRNGIYWVHDFHGEKADADLPVIHVSWNDAQAYVNWMSDQTGQTYRLPSESEWEYAVRGGTTTPYWWGSGVPDRVVENLTGEDDRSEAGRSWNRFFRDYDDGFWGPAPARRFIANPFGLFDIGGNVSEWVEDCWHDSYARAPADGSAWVNEGCDRRVVRGASWGSPPERSRSAYRVSGSPDTHTVQVGFRVARDL